MVHHFSSFDANCSLFLRHPWDYLHGMLGIQPPEEKNNALAEEVYTRGPFPYPDLRSLPLGNRSSETLMTFSCPVFSTTTRGLMFQVRPASSELMETMRAGLSSAAQKREKRMRPTKGDEGPFRVARFIFGGFDVEDDAVFGRRGAVGGDGKPQGCQDGSGHENCRFGEAFTHLGELLFRRV